MRFRQTLLVTIFFLSGQLFQNALAQQGENLSILDGIYNEGQAGRGEVAFRQFCQGCHTPRDFTGIIQKSSDNSRSQINAYYDLARLTMPQDSPGSLSEDMYLEIMAYFLSLN